MMMWYASLTLALLGFQVICGGSVLHHITPSSNLDCPIDEYCLNFSTFAANANNHTDSKDTALVLEFLVGNHILDSDFSISNITFLRLSTNSSNISTITCSRKALNMRFADIAEIEIQNLNFVDCGIMLQSVRQFVLEDSSFHATNGYGSSALQLNQIYVATITSSSFTFNSHDIKVGTIIDSGFQSSRGGGALAISESNLEIFQSQFIGNTAGLGGAILVERNSNVAINDSLFDNNSAGSCDGFNCYGGALHIDSGSTVTACNNTFFNNTSEFGGGAIAVFQSTYVDIQNVFHHNRAYYYRRGGIVYEFISGIVSHCSSNGIGGNGAAIFAQNNSQITLVNSLFSENFAENNGGVISSFFNCTVMAHNSSFENNSAILEAGVIHAIANCYTTLERCSFIGNRAAYAGVMYAEENSRVTVDSCSFDSNFATQDVGVFLVIQSNISIAKSSFTNNTAYNDVGVLYATLFDIVINNSSFQDNKAGSGAGVIYTYSLGRLAISNSSFLYNKADFYGGAAFVQDFSNVSFENCTFFNNAAFEGGVIFIRNVHFEDFGSTYIGNRAYIHGGVIALNRGHIKIRSSTFINNTAENNGGVLHTPIHRFVHTVLFEENTFDGNKAERGGVIALFNQDYLELVRNTFCFNKALDGGVVYLHTGNVVNIEGGSFSNNSAINGGVIHLVEQNSLTIRHSVLNFNSAENSGGVLYSLLDNEIYFNGSSCFCIGNQAHSGGVIHANGSSINLLSQTLVMENNRAADAGGAVYLSNTNLTFSDAGDNIIVKNTAKTGGALFAVKSSVIIQSNSLLIANNTAMESGGGIWVSQCQLTLFGGINELAENEAKNGGGVYASQSRVITIANSFTQMSSNTAILAGGGMYLTLSVLDIEQNTLSITENRAVEGAGGGIHASNSSITIEGVLHCANNQAKNGGGFSLERYTKLYGKSAKNDIITFFSNAASDHGGALYINDETNPDMCAVDPLQKPSSGTEYCFLNSYSPFFNTSGNSAGVSGSTLFGGLLDRCIIKPQFYKTAISGVNAFQKLSNVESDMISSHPVQMCFCRDFQPDCDYQSEPIQVQRQKTFSVQLIAYDQVNHTTKATVESSLKSSAGGLGEGQGTQQIIDGECTKLEFTLFSPLDSEELMLSLKSPCPNVTGVSKRSVRIEVICKCPIGFQLSNSANETACVCTCDDILQRYTRSGCNASTQSIIRRDEFWITFINQTNASGYQIYPYCPFDYCRPPSDQVSVNLNVPHGSDAQCAAHRSGTLCGSCEPGYSISLGSSHCLQCPSHWPWLVATIAVVFILSGMALVAFLLVLNLTVAIGTLNAIILYANVIAASRSALFPLKPSFASIFISFLNFDLGFDMCFFDRMDTYVKTWLQLAFPTYIIVLVALIIKLSYHYTWFGRLIGKKDPVATLATLILLSYTKLLQTIITSFSSATLAYPDGSRNVVWLPDATVEYFTTKHAVLFCTAILILLLGLVYTFLLFTWQWTFRLPSKHIKWLKNPKLNAFLEVYLVPYTPKHRYWTGLLLLVRVILYLVSAFNPSGDPRITLLSTAFIMSALFFYIAMRGVRMYKNRYINALEMLTYFNISVISIITQYSLGSTEINQRAVTNVSVVVTFVQLLIVIIYHCFTNIMVSNIRKTKIYQKLLKKFQGIAKMKYQFGHSKPTPVNVDTNINQINDYELLAIDTIDQRRQINTVDHNSPPILPEPAKPTQSVIEPPSPRSVSAAPAPCQQPTDPATGDNKYSIDRIEIRGNEDH